MRLRQLAISLSFSVSVSAARSAHADTLAAIALASDARSSILLGPSGQLYEPDPRAGWVRRRAGGVGDDVTVAVAVWSTNNATTVIAGAGDVAAAHAPPFRFRLVTGPHATAAWEMVPLALRAHAILGRGTRAVAAVGRAAFALDGATPRDLPDAPSTIVALGASPGGVTIATEHDRLLRLDGARWRALDHAPSAITALLDDRHALAAAGIVDLVTGATAPWPSGFPAVTAATAACADAAGDVAAAAAVTSSGSAGIEVVVVRDGHVDRDRIPRTALADPLAPIVGVAVDHDGRVVVALRDGRVAVRDHAAWTATAVLDDLPAARPGAPPATSR